MAKEHDKIKQSFLESYELYSDAIFRYAYMKTSDRNKALDIAQDTFTRAWEYASKGEPVLNMRALLYRIAHNLIVDEYRKKSTVSLDAMMEEGFDYGANNTERMIDQFDARDVIKLVDQIDPKYRDVVMWRYIDEMSVKEIADITGDTENTVSVRIHRGIEKLKNLAKLQNHENI